MSSAKKRLAETIEDRLAKPAKVLTIGAIARQLGMSASMIRAWEKLGLTHPRRTAGSYRVYSIDDLRALRRAVYLRKVMGLNAPAILNQLREEGLLTYSSSAAQKEAPPVGPRLRKLRLKRGDSLATVAEAVDVSSGFLSNVERSQSSASISVLHKLAKYYGVNILDFHSALDAAKPQVTPAERKSLAGGPGVQMDLLAWGKITMEPHLFRVAPGAGSGEFYSHPGEEFLFITSGSLVIVLEDTEYRLRTGDSFYFESKTPHRWHNPGNKNTIILWINTPPTF